MYQKKYRYILFTLLVATFFCSGTTTFCRAESSGDVVEKKMELSLPKEVLTSGSPFMIMMDSRGHQRVITYNRQPKKKLPEVRSDAFAADTMAVYAADSAMALMVEADAAASALPSERIIKTETTDYQQGTVGQQLAQALEVTVRDENDEAVPNTQVVFQVAKGGGTFVGGSTALTVTTDINGKASVELILGTKTADNPISWVEAGLNTEQVGLNVVECWPASIPSYKTIFSAYGFPGEPAVIKLHNDIVDISQMEVSVLTWVHDVLVSVLDQDENPISNIPVTVSAGDIIELSNEDCDKDNSDIRPALVLPIEEKDAEFPFAYESFAGYAGQPLIITSYHNL
ncbi:hypothetical protein VT99_10503 [Candidatus Electrothrix marina]|uniref:Big-1 domain-containing protein n=1 Tax=Candidatus Electrothrix marina TaxID=1859130 RepID=A0A444J712_9BACT|nr:hypothetical protein VT99_10503 [Candidatus Electrothrix marina]